MSNIFSSFFVDPVIRQARRVSSTRTHPSDQQASASASLEPPQSHGRSPPQTAAIDGIPPPDVTALAHGSNPDIEAAETPRHIDEQQHVRRRQTHPSRASRATAPRTEHPHSLDAVTHILTSPTRRHANSTPSSFTVAAVVDERTSNPAYGSLQHFRPPDRVESPTQYIDQAVPSGTPGGDTIVRAEEGSLADSSHTLPGTRAITMSESLPADDGMRLLRQRIHEIRKMQAPNEEKARRMHAIMTERYSHIHSSRQALRPVSPASLVSQDRPITPASLHSAPDHELSIESPASMRSLNAENPYNIFPEDLVPTFRAREAKQHSHGHEEEAVHDIPLRGCKHYQRNVKVQCFDCRRWYPCRHCHDAEESHALVRQKTENMLCMLCSTPQPAAEFCRKCGESAAYYYCDICKLWDDDSSKKIYHCIDCGICRRGEGLGKDFVHCKKCNVCISIGHANSHRCIERATDCDCPICGDYLFNSSTEVASMPCGHYMHRGCYDEYMKVAYKCPFCKKSAVNMELSWRKLTHAIESQPMPEQFANTKVNIQCNDCSAKSMVKYHWLGNQCAHCDSYNTNEVQLIAHDDNGNDQAVEVQPTPELTELREREIQHPSVGSPLRQRPTLRAASGSYFHNEGEQPVLVRRPSAAATALEQLRLSPYEMLQRVSRSLSPIRAYLNPAQERSLRLQEQVVAADDDIDGEFWGADGRFLSGDEGEDTDGEDGESEDDSSDDDARPDTPDEESDDEATGHALDELDQMPWHA